MIIVDCDQNSPEWDDIRLGIPTASRFKEIFTATGKRSDSRIKYLYELAGERISGERIKKFHSKNFDRGHEREEESASLYSLMTGRNVEKVGFCFKDENRLFGASPDRLIINELGGFETKDAEPHIQLKRLEDGWTGTEHKVQCMAGMLVTGYDWWDLQSYSRSFKPMVIRFERDEEYLSLLNEAVLEFCHDIEKLVKKHS